MRNAPLNYVNLPQQNKRGSGLKGLVRKGIDKVKEATQEAGDRIAGELDFKAYKKQNKSVLQEYPNIPADELYRANVQPSDTIVSRASKFNELVTNDMMFKPGGGKNVRKVGFGGKNVAVNKQEFLKYKLKQ